MSKKRIVQNSNRSPEQIERERAVRADFQQARPSLAALVGGGEFTAPVKQGEYLTLMEFAARVKQAREQQNLSLSDVSSRSGIDKSAISRLENGLLENPTIGTLMKVAKSLGKRIRIDLEDDCPVTAG